MRGKKYATYEQVAALADQIARISAQQERSTRPSQEQQKTSVLLALLEHAHDGRITVGEIITGMGTIALIAASGASIGLGMGMTGITNLGIVEGLRIGGGLGLAFGGGAVGLRTVADLYAGYDEGEDDDAYNHNDDPQHWEKPEFGLPIEATRRHGPSSYQVLRGKILPDVQRYRVEDMLRQAATLALIEGENFSKRGAGRAFGINFSDVHGEMLRLGFLAPLGDGPQAGYTLTSSGRQWLRQFAPSPK